MVSGEGGSVHDGSGESPGGTGCAGGTASMRDRRAHRRRRVLWGASLRCADDTVNLSVTVADISAGGAKLLFSQMPDIEEAPVVTRIEPGQRIVLILPEFGEFPGEIVWSEVGRLGLRFALDPATVAARLGSVVEPGNR